jgi:hypothetical protein
MSSPAYHSRGRRQGLYYRQEHVKTLLTVYQPNRRLRSTLDGTLLARPRSRLLTFGERAFSSAAPRLWNQLPGWKKLPVSRPSRWALNLSLWPLPTTLIVQQYVKCHWSLPVDVGTINSVIIIIIINYYYSYIIIFLNCYAGWADHLWLWVE